MEEAAKAGFSGPVITAGQALTASPRRGEKLGDWGKFRVVFRDKKLEIFLPFVNHAAYYT
jgi:hypothetical protein